jgi:hypothetical protein
MITLLSVMGDSDVRAKDTEVGKGTPLTSPFIEGICGKEHLGLPKKGSTDPSARTLLVLGRDDILTGLV